MRRTLTTVGTTAALVFGLMGAAFAHNPPGDPLPVNGEPDCFGARVSHSASEHGLTPKVKVDLTYATLDALANGWDPFWEDDYVAFWSENGVSVKSVQKWIRTNCSDDPVIGNP